MFNRNYSVYFHYTYITRPIFKLFLKQFKDKKILLVLTDGEPSDVDVQDQDYLKEDAKQAVRELSQKNIYSYCINLDKKADDYVKDIFGNQFSVIEKIDQLPEKLPKLFISLTK